MVDLVLVGTSRFVPPAADSCPLGSETSVTIQPRLCMHRDNNVVKLPTALTPAAKPRIVLIITLLLHAWTTATVQMVKRHG